MARGRRWWQRAYEPTLWQATVVVRPMRQHSCHRAAAWSTAGALVDGNGRRAGRSRARRAGDGAIRRLPRCAAPRHTSSIAYWHTAARASLPGRSRLLKWLAGERRRRRSTPPAAARPFGSEAAPRACAACSHASVCTVRERAPLAPRPWRLGSLLTLFPRALQHPLEWLAMCYILNTCLVLVRVLEVRSLEGRGARARSIKLTREHTRPDTQHKHAVPPRT